MNKKILIYIAIALLVLGLIILTFFPTAIYAARIYGKAGLDKCKTTAGYTEQEWREHMSHHPDIYKECLK